MNKGSYESARSQLFKSAFFFEKSNLIFFGSKFTSMIADWSFIEKDNFCEVTFSVAVSFSSFIKEKIVSISFEKIALNVIDAFERRARE